MTIQDETPTFAELLAQLTDDEKLFVWCCIQQLLEEEKAPVHKPEDE